MTESSSPASARSLIQENLHHRLVERIARDEQVGTPTSHRVHRIFPLIADLLSVMGQKISIARSSWKTSPISGGE